MNHRTETLNLCLVELESIVFSFVCHDWDFPSQSKPSYQQHESHNLGDNPTIRKGLEAITSSLNHLGDTFEKAFEEGRMIVESKTAELKTQIRLKGSHEDNESQLKASREAVKEILRGCDECFSIEWMEILEFKNMVSLPTVAALQGMIEKHFGAEIVDELFERFAEKVKEFPDIMDTDKLKLDVLFVLLRRKNKARP
ncbi:hypothetical protein Ahy_B08g092321 [Arachis hypogaea]|uniref:Uncharacterized protein n=1 Tax=Arachis hypogaea TaxID=3818 RepID=A0A444Y3P0_ARAHY|nr:hypothetical protein Ahy_B08g092321 [Arachis hypogaea]